MIAHVDDASLDKTQPLARIIRFDGPEDMFVQVPQVAEFVQLAPNPDESLRDYFDRLRNSDTPEDVVTVIAFTMDPQLAIDWALEAIQVCIPEMAPDDTQLMNWVGEWIELPNSENRWETLQRALFAPRRSAAVYLALAVGWSGGPLAPNDPVEMPIWRAPRAISSGVLRALGQVQLEQRPVALSQIIDLALNRLRLQ